MTEDTIGTFFGPNHLIATLGGACVEHPLPIEETKLPITTNQKLLFTKYLIHNPAIKNTDDKTIVKRIPLFSINQFVGIANIKYPI